MTSVRVRRNTLSILVLGLLLLASFSCGSRRANGAQVIQDELIVLCDVSGSLSAQTIKAESKIIIRFVQNDTAFRSGEFSVYPADRDVESATPYSRKKVFYEYKLEAEREVERLGQMEDPMAEFLGNYCKEHVIRNNTCLVKSLHGVLNLFSKQSKSVRRKILIVSDMLEDCRGIGNPRTSNELAARLEQSVKEFPLPDFSGVQVFAAVVPSARAPVDIDVLRAAWQKPMNSIHADFCIGTIDSILRACSIRQ
jgi:hypothetical protein